MKSVWRQENMIWIIIYCWRSYIFLLVCTIYTVPWTHIGPDKQGATEGLPRTTFDLRAHLEGGGVGEGAEGATI